MFDKDVKLSTVCLVTLALFDLVTTIMLLGRGMGEGNPLFAWLLQFGPWAFVLGKVAMVVGPILMLEYARTKNPELAEVGTWVAFLAYLILYVRHISALF